MNNDRLYGIVFRKGNNCGVAKITVYNTTTSKYISSTGIEESSLSYRVVDTYQSANYSNSERDFTYWISLEEDNDYDITIEHAGIHHPSSSSPYNINILRYISVEPLVDGSFSKTLQAYSSSFTSDRYTYNIVGNTEESLDQYSYFNGNGVTQVFGLSSNEHAYKPVLISNDGGTIWLYPSDVSLTWGSNSPDYDDETIDANGYFAVNFIDPPDTGTNNVVIRWRPLINKYNITTLSNQPYSSDMSYIDYRTNIRQLDYVCEMIKES